MKLRDLLVIINATQPYEIWLNGKKVIEETTDLQRYIDSQGAPEDLVELNLDSEIRKIYTKTLNASDQDWYFTKETILNAVRLTQYLMQQYNIDINHVIMHHMVTGKICPNPWCVTQDRLPQWYIFTQLVSAAPAPVPTPAPEP